MTCSELLLKFFEFLIYFKFDTIYSRCSIEKEGYFNMSEIEDTGNEDELYKYSFSYYYYFFKDFIR